MVKDVQTGICHRADHLLEDRMDQLLAEPGLSQELLAEYTRIKDAAGNMNAAELDEYLSKYNAKAPETGNDISPAYEFNLMFETQIGPSGQSTGYVVALSLSLAPALFLTF